MDAVKVTLAPKNERLVHYGRGCHETSIQLVGVLEHKVLGGFNDGGFPLLAEKVDVLLPPDGRSRVVAPNALLPDGLTGEGVHTGGHPPVMNHEQAILMSDHGRFVGNTALEGPPNMSVGHMPMAARLDRPQFAFGKPGQVIDLITMDRRSGAGGMPDAGFCVPDLLPCQGFIGIKSFGSDTQKSLLPF